MIVSRENFNVIILNVAMAIIMLNDKTLSVIMQIIIMLHGIRPSVIMLIVVAPQVISRAIGR